MEKKKARVAVLVSGGGTNLQAIIDAEKSGIIHSGMVALVVSNNENAYAVKRAEQAGIPSRILLRRDFRSQAGFEEALVQLLLKEKIDVIVLAGFMTILSEAFTKRFPKRILNVHPSLIPSFCGQGFYGLKVHEEALKRGVKVTGATVHFVNEIPDGGEILFQKAVEVLGDDTPEILQRRVMEEAEWILLPKAVEEVSKRVNMNVK
ncbi:MAG: phosphoribosylglycinamide formyltransferase [Parasporobacterium sp.]|nr:phosphoribosylglycinamide formyltransferase [Parasporobacterium sp.]